MSQSNSFLPIHLAARFSSSHTTSLHMVSLRSRFLLTNLNDSRVLADFRDLAAHYLFWVISSEGPHPSAIVTLKLLVHSLALFVEPQPISDPELYISSSRQSSVRNFRGFLNIQASYTSLSNATYYFTTVLKDLQQIREL